MNCAIKRVGIKDTEYPDNLRQIYDPPEFLYIRGDIQSEDRIAIAIVGTRLASYYGLSTAERLAYDLASYGFTIVSGMARGIDSAAHRGALNAKGRTIAVFGSGLDYIYPPENKELADRICECGAVISEFPQGTVPRKGNFPKRNRLISGLSLGVIVVEAGLNSGALITANLALEQGREVFSVPGHANTFNTKGTHQLLREGARLVESADDIIEELEPIIKNMISAFIPMPITGQSSLDNRSVLKPANLPHLEFNEDEKRIYSTLSSTNPMHLDDIIEQGQLPANRVSSILTILEIKGLVKHLPGKRFLRQ